MTGKSRSDHDGRRLMASIAIAIFGLILTAGLVPGQPTPSCSVPSFLSAGGYAAGLAPQAVAVGDLNLDGVEDVVVANAISDDVSILLGDGFGAFGAPGHFPAGTEPSAVVIGRFNGDTFPDVAVANQGSSDVSLLLGDGQGGLGPATSFAVGDDPRSLAAADFNGDGVLDLVVVSTGTANLVVLLGNGTGGFGPAASFPSGPSPRRVVIADFDGNGDADAAVTNGMLSGGTVSILLGDGQGSLGAPTPFATGNLPIGLTTGDFDGDGAADLAVANFGLFMPASIAVLLGDGQGGLGPATPVSAGVPSNAIVTADFDGDTNLDLAFAGIGNRVSVVLGDGTGSFGAPTDAVPNGLVNSLVAGDFNLDGVPDLAAATSVVSILLGDGQGDFQTAEIYLAGQQVDSMTVGDFDEDGNPDLAVASVTVIGPGEVSVLPGDGQAGFGPPTSVATVGLFPQAIVTGDFNGDGHLDLATAVTAADEIAVQLGDGAGAFVSAPTITALANPRAVAVADFDGDGDEDLVVANSFPDSVTILVGDGTGGFSVATNATAGTDPWAVVVGHFDADSNVDVAVANFTSGDASILLGDGAGGLGLPTSIPVGMEPRALVTGDLNEDGLPDLCVANGASATISVLLGDGQGGFASAMNHVVGNDPRSLVTVDLDADGHLDVAVAGEDYPHLSVLLGDGQGNLSAAVPFATSSARFIVASDVDLDGRPDLILSLGSTVLVLKNLCSPSVPGPLFSPASPAGQTLGASVGVPFSYTMAAGAMTGLLGNRVTLDATGVPTGASHSPALPLADGATPSATFQWTPQNGDVGTHVVTYLATDQLGRTTTTTVTIEVAECYLLLGWAPTAVSLGGGDQLLVSPEWHAPVTLSSVPSFDVPLDPGIAGVTLHAQVAMINPTVFPADPIQLTNGVAIMLGQAAVPYGSGGSSMNLWLTGSPNLGATLSFGFSIPGP